MHQLGEELNPEEKKERIRRILTARRRLYNAGVELLSVTMSMPKVLRLSRKDMPLPAICCLSKESKQRKSKLMKPMFASILKCGSDFCRPLFA